MISDFYPPVSGGLEYHVDALAAELRKQGDDVAVATLTRNARATDPRVRLFGVSSATGLLPHHDADRPFQPPVPEPISRISLSRIIRAFEPDVIHGHSLLTTSVPPTVGAPVLFTAHDYGLVCQLRTMMHAPQYTCSGPELKKCIDCGSATYGRVVSNLLARGTVYGLRRFPAHRVVAVSESVRSALRPAIQVPISVIPNFVGDAAPAEALPETVPERFVLFAGDGRPYKGVPELLDVWRNGKPSVPLVIASQRPPAEPLPSGVVCVSLTRGQMTQAWRQALLAVVPSRWADPCPTVVLEAFRAGVPVVGTRRGGIAEMVRADQDGVLVGAGDSEALGSAIVSLLADDRRRDRMAESARARAAGYTASAVGQRIRATYQEMLDNRTS